MLVATLVLVSRPHRVVATITLTNGLIGYLVANTFGATLNISFFHTMNDLIAGFIVVFFCRNIMNIIWQLGLIFGLSATVHLLMISSVLLKTPTIFYVHYELLLIIIQLSCCLIFHDGMKYATKYFRDNIFAAYSFLQNIRNKKAIS